MRASTNEGSYLAANSNGRKFLYNSKGLERISLLVKYYLHLAHFNKVIKLLKFKSAVFLMGGAIERERERERAFYCEISFGGALSIAPPIRNTANSLQI